jgi:hypothetical protein
MNIIEPKPSLETIDSPGEWFPWAVAFVEVDAFGVCLAGVA